MGRSPCDSSYAAFHNKCRIQDQINCIWVIWRTFKVFVLSLLGICRNPKITYKYEWGTVQLIAQSLSFIQFVPFPLLYCSPTLMSNGWDPSFPSTASQGNNRKVSRGVGPSDQWCRMSSIFCIAIHDEALLQGVSERLHWFTTELWGFDEKGGEVAQPCNRRLGRCFSFWLSLSRIILTD